MEETLEGLQLEWVEKVTPLLASMAERLVKLEERVIVLEAKIATLKNPNQ